MLERIDGNGTIVYHKNNKLHRPNGPAVIWASGEVFWHLNNRLHRYYGTATNLGWWIHGKSQGD